MIQEIQILSQLELLDKFVYHLYECAADPTEAKINEFHSKYNEAKRQELQAALPFQTWGDKEIFTQGIAILQKIGVGAPLDEVREDLKKAAVDHFMADFLNCADRLSTTNGYYNTHPETAEKIADLYNDYNNKLEYIGKIIDNKDFIESIKSFFDRVRIFERMGGRADILMPQSCVRNFLLKKNGISNHIISFDCTIENLQLVLTAAQHDKERFGKAAADACFELYTEVFHLSSDREYFYNTCVLPYYGIIKEYLLPAQVVEMERFSNIMRAKQTQTNAVVANTSNQAEPSKVEKQGSFTKKVTAERNNVMPNKTDIEQGKKDAKGEIVETQTNATVANTSNQAETPKVEKPSSFTEQVSSSRSNENGKGGPAL